MKALRLPFVLAAYGFAAIACGIPALDPSQVTKLMVDAHSGKVCPWHEAKIDLAVTLKDGKLRATNGLDNDSKIDARKDFSFSASAGKMSVRVEGVYVVPPPDYSFLLENDITVSANLVANPAMKAETQVIPDFSCKEEMGSGGEAGYAGEAGYPGDESGYDGGPGGNGANGEQGYDASPVEVYVGMVDTPKRGRLVVARLVRPSDGAQDIRLVAPGPKQLIIVNRGGAGGAGGPGGYGGRGDNTDKGCRGGRGGSGGNGANGANGGNGAAVSVFYDQAHPELRDMVVVDNSGGSGGAAGAGGDGGSGGTSSAQYCQGDTNGGNGSGANPGFAGRNGASGPQPTISPTTNPFPSGLASIGVRAASSEAGPKHVKGPPSGPPPGAGTGTGTGTGTLPTAAAFFAAVPGPFAIHFNNKSKKPICSLVPLNHNDPKPAAQNLLTGGALAPGVQIIVGKWGLPKGAPASATVRFQAATCDGKLVAIGIASPPKQVNLVVYAAIPNPVPTTEILMVLGKP